MTQFCVLLVFVALAVVGVDLIRQTSEDNQR